MKSRRSDRRGVALIIALALLTFLALVGGSLMRQALATRKQARREEGRLRASWLSASGLEKARARLAADPSYRGERWTISETTPGNAALVVITVEPLPDRPNSYRITSRADTPPEGESRSRRSRTLIFQGDRP